MRESQARTGTIFAFLSHSNARTTSALSVLHSLIFQLASGDEALQTALCELNRGNLKNSLAVTCEILSTLLRCAGPVNVVIDGVDEIEEIERGILTQRMLELLKECDDVKLLVSSRIEADLEARIGDQADSLRVDDHNAGSIEAFVEQWTDDWFQRQEITEEGQIEIRNYLDPLPFKAKGLPSGYRLLGNIVVD